MKKRVALFVLFLPAFLGIYQVSFSQAPQKFTYQAVARNGNTLLADHVVDVKLSLLQGSETGSIAWEETHTGISTNAYGLFTLQAGSLTAIDIDWDNGPYFLKVEMDPKDGGGYVDLGAQELTSVPYALKAGSVSTLKELNIEGAGTADPALPLFEVKRPDGQTVFAVYADSIRMYVNATAGKGHKGGFAIGGFDAT